MTIDFLTLLLLCIAALFLGITLVLRTFGRLVERNSEEKAGLGCLNLLFCQVPFSISVIFTVLALLWGLR